MKNLVRCLAAAGLAAFVATSARAACTSSANAWTNTPFTAQSAPFTATFDVTPQSAKMDGVIGLANGSASDFSKLAAIVRFNTNGGIDARNGGVYSAATAVPYS